MHFCVFENKGKIQHIEGAYYKIEIKISFYYLMKFWVHYDHSKVIVHVII